MPHGYHDMLPSTGRPRIAIYFASHDGQTRKIVMRIAEKLGAAAISATMIDLGVAGPPAVDADADLVLVASAIRYGYHLGACRRYLRLVKASVPAERIAVLSVNLTARKPGRQTAEGNIYLRKWLLRTGLQPAFSAAIAGRLDYPAYRWYDRKMIQAIMTISGGPTDPATVVEYTDWDQVDVIAGELAKLVTRPA